MAQHQPSLCVSSGSLTAAQDAAGFPPGQRVAHPKFGEGVVLNAEGQGSGARVQVNFEAAGASGWWWPTRISRQSPDPDGSTAHGRVCCASQTTISSSGIGLPTGSPGRSNSPRAAEIDAGLALHPSAMMSRFSVLPSRSPRVIASSSASPGTSLTNERSILSLLIGRRFQIGERGIAGAEVVDRQADAEVREGGAAC